MYPICIQVLHCISIFALPVFFHFVCEPKSCLISYILSKLSFLSHTYNFLHSSIQKDPERTWVVMLALTTLTWNKYGFQNEHIGHGQINIEICKYTHTRRLLGLSYVIRKDLLWSKSKFRSEFIFSDEVYPKMRYPPSFSDNLSHVELGPLFFRWSVPSDKMYPPSFSDDLSPCRIRPSVFQMRCTLR